MSSRLLRLAALLGVLALILAACGGDATDDPTTTAAAPDAPAEEPMDEEPMDEEPGEMTGQVNLDGSSTVGPLSEVAAELYMQSNPGVRVTVAISGTGGGFQKFCIGETDGNNSSRPITEEEIGICGDNGIESDFIQVANDALSLLVNAELPVECMTVEQVSQIWDLGSTVETWGDIDGLDLPADVASQPITVYGPGSDSGTFDFFTEEINGESGKIRLNYVDIGEDDNAAVTAVIGDPYAMGYVPYSYFQEAGDAVKSLAIDDGNGCVEAIPENIENLTYTPLGRGLFVYFSDTALQRPEVLDFAEFYIDNAQQIAELAEFIPMTDEQLDAQRAKIAALIGG